MTKSHTLELQWNAQTVVVAVMLVLHCCIGKYRMLRRYELMSAYHSTHHRWSALHCTALLTQMTLSHRHEQHMNLCWQTLLYHTTLAELTMMSCCQRTHHLSQRLHHQCQLTQNTPTHTPTR